MNEFESWLDEMAIKPLPGGVAAAAVAAAMGAALGAKAVSIGGSRQAPESTAQRARRAVVDLAQASRIELLQLATADQVAYQCVLDTRHLPAGGQSRRRAWEGATDLPLSLAEVCRRLLAALSSLEEAGPPGVAVDLEIGRRLLDAGAEAGMLAARENLRAWGASWDSSAYQQRLAALLGEEFFDDRSTVVW